MPAGRFAPSPTGPLHLGNLRTALVAWLRARSTRSPFLLRFEDLDPAAARVDQYDAQLHDLASLGLDWDGPVERQSQRLHLYEAAFARLVDNGDTYPCYCTRREVHEAAQAPHGPGSEGLYAGTCRELSERERSERERAGRAPAVRLRATARSEAFTDAIHGDVSADVDDFVLRRRDGVFAYNLAVVVDDVDQRIEEVVRGDDLLHTTGRQVHLARRLGLAVPSYVHVPLVLGPDGSRLAKRDGAVTLGEREALGQTPADVLRLLAESLELANEGERVTARDLVDRFDLALIPRRPWVLR